MTKSTKTSSSSAESNEASLSENVIDNFLRVQIKYLQATAMYPIDYGSKLPAFLRFLSPVFNLIFYIIVLFISLHIAVLHAITSINTIGKSLDDLSDFCTLTIIYSFTFFIVSYFLARQSKCMKMFRYLNENFRQRSAPGLTFVTANQSYKTTTNYLVIWIILCLAGVILWAIYPLLVGKRILPLRCWYPIDELAPYVYEGIYFIQFLGQIEVGLAFGMVSGLYMSMVMLICGQFDILFCSLKNVYHTAMLLNGNHNAELKYLQESLNPEDEEVNQYFFTANETRDKIHESFTRSHLSFQDRPNLKKELQASLKDCIKHHEIILNVCEMLEDFFNPFCLIKSLQVTFQFCFLAFVFVNTASSAIRTINLAEYLFLTLAELLMFTYYGEVLQQQSVKLADALFRSPWHLFGPDIKHEILIALPSVYSRPATLTGGKFFTMNVERFRLIVGTSFSYFTLLQNLGS